MNRKGMFGSEFFIFSSMDIQTSKTCEDYQKSMKRLIWDEEAITVFEHCDNYYPPEDLNKPRPAQVGAISRLKNSKKTSKCQVFSFTILENQKFSKKNGPSGALKSHNAKKLKGGTLWGFSTFILSQNIFWGKKFSGKKVAVPKKIERGDPLVSPGMVWYAGKQEKLFWFSSLDQIVQFGAIIFCRTFKNYFGQFVWIEKKEKPL